MSLRPNNSFKNRDEGVDFFWIPQSTSTGGPLDLEHVHATSMRGHRFMLLREYIHRSLYEEGKGYFQNTAPPVAAMRAPIDFSELAGRSDYEREIGKAYAVDIDRSSWLTPAEIFQPYYAYAIARRIERAHLARRTGGTRRSDKPDGHLCLVVEIGAGTGTLAHGILTYLRSVCGLNAKYILVEISSSCIALQKQRLQEFMPSKQVQWIQKCATMLQPDDFKPLGVALDEAHVVATEVLDNMPHDCIVYDENSKGYLQTVVEARHGTGVLPLVFPTLHRFPLEDGPIQRALGVWFSADREIVSPFPWHEWIKQIFHSILPNDKYSAQQIFIPTMTVKLLDAIKRCFRNHLTLTFADFDYLPNTLPGEDGPLIQMRQHKHTIPFSAFEDAPMYKCDIMFPTNFHYFQSAVQSIFSDQRTHVEVMKSDQFIRQHNGDKSGTQTLSGYDPLLDDFKNTSFLLGTLEKENEE
ncbi:hypothetical protein FVE85_0236 [Porphyridium purpureum]|uniref:Protein arginine methyltransferase NDUFAF7 n=1 Tax=Porphyridium purpureum TaxID=35688 RepID=A0A5J4Z1G1_PORPP|nr:hypothetical protein FVE85_0236 [Porphyridium purpureum]|eukprot:POR7908..scf208_2